MNIPIFIDPLLLIALLICIIQEAFSKKGVASSVRFAYATLRAIGHNRKMESPSSS